jgi:hypothetical protein
LNSGNGGINLSGLNAASSLVSFEGYGQTTFNVGKSLLLNDLINYPQAAGGNNDIAGINPFVQILGFQKLELNVGEDLIGNAKNFNPIILRSGDTNNTGIVDIKVANNLILNNQSNTQDFAAFQNNGGAISIAAGGDIQLSQNNLSSISNNTINIQADAPFSAGNLWTAQSAIVGGNNIFQSTPLENNSAAQVSDGYGAFSIKTGSVGGSLNLSGISGNISILSADNYTNSTNADLVIGTGNNNLTAKSTTGSVSIQGFDNITFASSGGIESVKGSVNIGANNDVLVNANLAGINSNNLSLRAGNNITTNNSISTNGGNISLIADYDFSSLGGPISNGIGSITVNNDLSSLSGDINIAGASIDLKGNISGSILDFSTKNLGNINLGNSLINGLTSVSMNAGVANNIYGNSTSSYPIFNSPSVSLTGNQVAALTAPFAFYDGSLTGLTVNALSIDFINVLDHFGNYYFYPTVRLPSMPNSPAAAPSTYPSQQSVYNGPVSYNNRIDNLSSPSDFGFASLVIDKGYAANNSKIGLINTEHLGDIEIKTYVMDLSLNQRSYDELNSVENNFIELQISTSYKHLVPYLTNIKSFVQYK